jgi:hypothetical protein
MNWLNDKQSNMSFKGKFSEDGTTITGTLKWLGGGYDLVMKCATWGNFNEAAFCRHRVRSMCLCSATVTAGLRCYT